MTLLHIDGLYYEIPEGARVDVEPTGRGDYCIYVNSVVKAALVVDGPKNIWV